MGLACSYLGVTEQEHHLLAVNASRLIELLQVLTKLTQAIPTRQLDGECVVACSKPWI